MLRALDRSGVAADKNVRAPPGLRLGTLGSLRWSRLCLLNAHVLPRENLADDVFDGDFLDVDVGDRQFVEQRFADRNDAVALLIGISFDAPRLLANRPFDTT